MSASSLPATPFKGSLRWTLRRWATSRLCPDFKEEKLEMIGQMEHMWAFDVICWICFYDTWGKFVLSLSSTYSSQLLLSLCTTFPRTNVPNKWQWTSSYPRHSLKKLDHPTSLQFTLYWSIVSCSLNTMWQHKTCDKYNDNYPVNPLSDSVSGGFTRTITFTSITFIPIYHHPELLMLVSLNTSE